MDNIGSTNRENRVLAPLASSETFSDVNSIFHDEQQTKKDLPSVSNSEEKTTRINRNNDFDSLEILFDFPSMDLTTDSQRNLQRPSHSPSRIRFAQNTQIINSSGKV